MKEEQEEQEEEERKKRRRSTYFFHHADHETLLEATELATISATLVDRASFFGEANVFGTLLNRPLEETFTTLARTHAVVLTRCRVTANGAQLARAWRCTFTGSAASG